MGKKIIVSSDEIAVCPKCNHQFSLDQGIARHTIERYEQEFSDALASEKKELEESLAREAERKANKLFAEQIAKLKEDLADVRKAEQDARALVTKAEADAKAKAAEAFAQEKSALTEELTAKNAQLASFREQELALRRQKQVLEDKQANWPAPDSPDTLHGNMCLGGIDANKKEVLGRVQARGGAFGNAAGYDGDSGRPRSGTRAQRAAPMDVECGRRSHRFDAWQASEERQPGGT
ncbi:Uncharacterized protein ToN1_40380 [Aromatoleum petrolei]|nr:Uncharacterized protein ToN1_40380 [Aromatoleum petrolei]